MKHQTKDLSTGCVAARRAAVALLSCLPVVHGAEVEQWTVFETSYESTKVYSNAFTEVEVDVVFKQGERQWKVPAFWTGDGKWTVRFAPPLQGKYTYRVECTDKANPDLNGKEQTLSVTAYKGDNPLLKHGFVQASPGKRYFEHADGTPFLWLGDTWWKCLCKRMTWEGFQELTADRKAKGFSVVQIVCGPYPDENFFAPSLENEGGQPYLAKDMSVVNPKYFDSADRRFKHLVDAGIVPAIVGAWGRGDCNSMQAFGVVNIKRHWRYLIARYGAYPVVWILAGEIADETKWGQGPWAEVAKYVREIDPYKHPLTCHTGQGRRGTEGDGCLIDYDMVGGSHDERAAVANGTLALITNACAKKPAMPVLCGETCYEGHMQQGFGDVQRHIFWRNMLSSAAGHTYGAAGIWHAGVEGDHGNWGAWNRQPYDWTTWEEGMTYPGATQLGLGKKLLEQYPWHRFEPHPEWTGANCSAAGIPGEVRFIYQPRGKIYDWTGTVVKNLEPGVRYSAFYFDPATGRRFDQGIIETSTGEYQTKGLPSPQDWVLVLELVKMDNSHKPTHNRLTIMHDLNESLKAVPQINETATERDERMQWFRDAKFGMFIHWGPCSVGQKEIGWGREGNRPWDINKHGPITPDPEYDNYYKVFNPVKYDADAWVKFAKESGMKYMVLITKHHDGFSQFDTKLSDYSIMHSPYGRDIVKQFVDACHRHGLKAGLYYSTRDWYHPDYLVGDNKKYDQWYRGQIEELLTNYGEIDMLWYDHVGGRDWSKWRFDELFAMMYRRQPRLLVNNRAARFCGPATPEDQGPASPEIKKMTDGDFYTPEGRIGAMDIANDWESCIHVGQGWSYRGEDGFRGPEDCIKMLVSCTTGGGNLLLNFGPRPDGTFAEGEAAVARAAGDWLRQYGEAIYGTRGGPYRNGAWGGSCHKGNKLFLHVYEWSHGPLALAPLPRRVLAARTLTGKPVVFQNNEHELQVSVAEADRDKPVTVVELTIDEPIPPGTLYRVEQTLPTDLSEFGKIVSEQATFEMSSVSEHDQAHEHDGLFRGKRSPRGFAFHTGPEENPWIKVDLGVVKNVKAVLIENRPEERRTEGLILSVSDDGQNLVKVWQAKEWEEKWLAVVTRFHAGIDVPGRMARYLKFETKGYSPCPLLLQRVTVYGE